MADASAVFAYASDPDVTRFLAFRTLTHVDEAKSFIARCAASAKADTAYTWLIVHPDEAGPIGAIELRVKGGTGDIGYVIRKPWWGQGIVPEAVRALIAFARDRLRLQRITGLCDCENERSARVFLKSGFQETGIEQGTHIHPQLGSAPRPVRCFQLDLT